MADVRIVMRQLRKCPGVRRILLFDENHPAHRMLRAFVECRRDCVGKEIDWPDQPGVDQEWYSESDGKSWRFSSFAYIYISYTPTFPEWADESFPKELTDNERCLLEHFVRFDLLMAECESAAIKDENSQVVEMARQVREMYRLWGDAIRFRIGETT